MPSAFSLPLGAFSASPYSGSSGGMATPSDLLFGDQGAGYMSSQVDPSLTAVPTIPGVTGSSPSPFAGLGMNMDTAKLALSGLGTIGNLYAAFQAQNLAKQQFNFTKGITTTNLANQIKSYNTTLEDRSRSRAAVEGQSAADAQSYVDKNKLTSSF